MTLPDLVIFDLDDTLAPSKSLVPKDIAISLTRLLDVADICVISGARFEQFESQLLSQIDDDQPRLSALHIMPTCGTRYYRWANGEWAQVYAEELTDAEKRSAIDALEEVAKELDFWTTEVWGERLEDRGSQITYSALGQLAPVDVKRQWDPTGRKRELMRQRVQNRLPDLEVRSGGSTSIDVTRSGIDKAYGVSRLVDLLCLSTSQLLFVGDRLEEGGNDYPVRKMGIMCIEVGDWRETEQVIELILADEWRSRVISQTEVGPSEK